MGVPENPPHREATCGPRPAKGGATLGAKPREMGTGRESGAGHVQMDVRECGRRNRPAQRERPSPLLTRRSTLARMRMWHAATTTHPGTRPRRTPTPTSSRSVRWWTNSALSEVHAADLVPLHCPDRYRRAAPLRRAVYAPGRGSSRSSDWRGFRKSAFKEDALSGIADELECTRVRQGGRRVIVEPAEATANRTERDAVHRRRQHHSGSADCADGVARGESWASSRALRNFAQRRSPRRPNQSEQRGRETRRTG